MTSMTKYRVTFWNSEAAIDLGHTSEERSVTADGGVQLTYDELRETSNGDSLAFFDRGLWTVYTAEGALTYSDISIVVIDSACKIARELNRGLDCPMK